MCIYIYIYIYIYIHICVYMYMCIEREPHREVDHTIRALRKWCCDSGGRSCGRDGIGGSGS